MCEPRREGLRWSADPDELLRDAADEIERLRAQLEAAQAAPWQHLAYAKLGIVRDKMSPHDVEVVQAFLGPLDAAMQAEGASP